MAVGRRKTGDSATLLRLLGLVTVCVSSIHSEIAQPCPSNIYCHGDLLKTVQLANIYTDSKTFVDMKLIKSVNDTLANFKVLMTETNGDPSRGDIESFVIEHFSESEELEIWSPPDHTMSPAFLDKIDDLNLKEFAKTLLAIWPTLGRKAIKDVAENPDIYSFIYIPNGFIIPGGRFREIYYWDTYWIVKGLLISEMKETVKGVLENFLYLVKKFGHIPNGSRVYYIERSQPPLLTLMVKEYIDATNDLEWLKNNIATIEDELEFWFNKRTILFKKDLEMHKLLHYNAESSGPRPESYREDYILAQTVSENERQQLYTNIKSTAESGWDFSSRWFMKEGGCVNGCNLTDTHTPQIIPVDLNAIYANACKILGDFYNRLGNSRSSKKWLLVSAKLVNSIQQVLWDHDDGVWYDYDLVNKVRRKAFYPSNVFPLWLKSYPSIYSDSYYAGRVLDYLDKSGALDYPGGIPSSLKKTGQQWDLPNAWAPLQAAVIIGLHEADHKEANLKAKQLAQKWLSANYIGFKNSSEMFEKYDAEVLGQFGGGGEYVIQAGFGWTNGFAIQCLEQFGSVLKVDKTTN